MRNRINNIIKKGNSIKTINLNDGTYLHFWYANNKGRGTNNCTIVRSTESSRSTRSNNQYGVLAKVQTSAWMGKINFSNAVYACLNPEYL